MSLEQRYRDKQPALVRKTVLLAVLGYFVLALSLVLAVALALGCVTIVVLRPNVLTIKLGLVIGLPAIYLAIAVCRGIWVRLHAPEGVRVTRKEAPALFAMIDEVGAKAGGVRFDQVLLNHEMNAAVVEIPRLGVFGWYKRYLLLGVPLMDALSPAEFQSVVAHEFAHLSHQHGRLGTWLYRLRATWERVMEKLSENGVPRPLLKFISWFWPRFNASAFVLSRSQEYQADAFAAHVTSPETSGCALQRLELEFRRVDELFWEGIGNQVARVASPPRDVFDQMRAFLKTEHDADQATRWLSHAMARITDTSNTHPALKDRLAALGVIPSISPHLTPIVKSAAEEWLLGDFAQSVRDHFSGEWHKHIAPNWERGHKEKAELKERLETMEASEDLSEKAVWDRLWARIQLEGLEPIQDELARFLEDHPNHVMANYARGRYLAEQDDLAAIPYLETMMMRPDAVQEGLSVLAGLYDRIGRGEEIAGLKRRADQHDKAMEEAVRERNYWQASDQFLTPDVTADESEMILKVIRSQPKVKAAWLVKKEVKQFPEWRSYILLLDVKLPVFTLSAEESRGKVLRAVVNEIEIDASLLAIAKDNHTKPVTKKIIKIEGAQLI